jgi:hypothetical protein
MTYGGNPIPFRYEPARRRSTTAASGAGPEPDTLYDRVKRATARWLKRVMYETTATSTEKCFAYSVADHLNCVTLDSWPGQLRLAKELGRKSIKTAQRAAQGLERLGVLTLKRNGKKGYRYAPVFLPGDGDKNVRTGRQYCPEVRDKNVHESLLGILSTSSSPTEEASEGIKQEQSDRPKYNRRQRGAIELALAPMLGKDGIEALARLSAFDDAIVDRLCRAHAEGMLGEREVLAARLAVDQL